jgi:hypothetical protein
MQRARRKAAAGGGARRTSRHLLVLQRMRVAVEVSNEHLCQSDISNGFPVHVAAMMSRLKARR